MPHPQNIHRPPNSSRNLASLLWLRATAAASRRRFALRLALALLLTLAASSRQTMAESSPWFEEFLIKFPEPLLLEREPAKLLPPLAAEAAAAQTDSRISQVSAVPAEEPSQEFHPSPPVSLPQPAKSPPCACTQKRRYIFSERDDCRTCEFWQILPDGVLYPSYIAGEKEPRMGTAILQETDRGPLLESTIGGRLGLLRYGTPGPINPQGWQWDLESAAMLRQDFEEELDVEATDFRIGSVLTYRRNSTAVKGGIYHLSSHVGDEFLERNPTFVRRNYSRDALLFGVYHWLTDALRIYGEVAVAVRNDGGSEPLELQFGTEYSSPAAFDPSGAPFAAINAHLREEFDFGGSVNILAGWEWRGPTSNRRFRIGGQFYSGNEIQWSFFDEHITLVGAGIWYDF